MTGEGGIRTNPWRVSRMQPDSSGNPAWMQRGVPGWQRLAGPPASLPLMIPYRVSASSCLSERGREDAPVGYSANRQ